MEEENIVEDDSELTLNEIEKSAAIGVSLNYKVPQFIVC